MKPHVLFCILTTGLTLNVVVARALKMGPESWEKSAIVVSYWALLLALTAGERVRWRVKPGRLALLRTMALVPFLAVLVCFEHHSILPRWPVLFVLCLLVAVINRDGPGWLSAPFLVCASIIVGIGAVDLIWDQPAPGVFIERDPPVIAVADPILGYRPKEGLNAKIRCWREDSLVYEVRYDFDEFSRRIVPQTPTQIGEENRVCRDQREPRHALFMGGSGVFGENIDNEETLPAHFARIAKSYRVYNYAFSGYGPQQMYELLRSSRLLDAVSEPSGILIYGFIPDHIRRANGTYVTLSWGSGFPCYAIDGDRLKHRGSFAQTRRCTISFFNLLRSSASLDRLAITIDNTISLRRSAWKTFLTLVSASRDAYLEAFNGEFYVFHSPFSKGHFDDLADSLRSRGVTVLDIAAFGARPPAQDETVPFDPHPNGRYNAKVALALSRALKARNHDDR